MVNPSLLKLLGNTFLGKFLGGIEDTSAVDQRIAAKLKIMLGKEVSIEGMKRESLKNIKELDKYMLKVKANKAELEAAIKIEGQEKRYEQKYESLVKQQTEYYLKIINSLKLLCTHEFFKMVYDVKKPLDVYQNYFTKMAEVMQGFVKNGGNFDQKTEEQILLLIEEVQGNYRNILAHVEKLINKDHEIYKHLMIINGALQEGRTLTQHIEERTKITRSISLEMARITKKIKSLEKMLARDVKSESGQKFIVSIQEFRKTIINMLQLSFKRVILSNQIVIYVKRMEADIHQDLKNLENEIKQLKGEIVQEVKSEEKIIKEAETDMQKSDAERAEIKKRRKEQKARKNKKNVPESNYSEVVSEPEMLTPQSGITKDLVNKFRVQEHFNNKFMQDLNQFEEVVKTEEIGAVNAIQVMDKEITEAEKEIVALSTESNTSLNQAKEIIAKADTISKEINTGRSYFSKLILAMIISILSIFQSPAKTVVDSFTQPETLGIDLAAYVRDYKGDVFEIEKNTPTDDLEILQNTVDILNDDGEMVAIGPGDAVDKIDFEVKQQIEKTKNEVKTTTTAEAQDIKQVSWNTLKENWVFMKHTHIEIDTNVVAEFSFAYLLSPDFKKLDTKDSFRILETNIDNSFKDIVRDRADGYTKEMKTKLESDFKLLTEKQRDSLSKNPAKNISMTFREGKGEGFSSPEGKLGEKPSANNVILSQNRSDKVVKTVIQLLEERNNKTLEVDSKEGNGKYFCKTFFDSVAQRFKSVGRGIIVVDPRIEKVVNEINEYLLLHSGVPSFLNPKETLKDPINYSTLGEEKMNTYFDHVMKSLKAHDIEFYKKESDQLPRFVKVQIDMKLKMDFDYKVVHKILRVIPHEGIPVFFDWSSLRPGQRLRWDDVKYKPLRGHKQRFRINHPRQEAGHFSRSSRRFVGRNYRSGARGHYVNKSPGT